MRKTSSKRSAKLPPVTSAVKKIRLRAQEPVIAEAIERSHTTSSVAARILAARGFEPGKKLDTFIAPSLRDGLPEPGDLKNLNQAAQLIAAVVAKKQKVAIACDFDVDGLSGGAQLVHFLRAIGVQCKAFVPDRFSDGYGLNEKIIRQAAQESFALLIAIDFGTTSSHELSLAADLGIKTVVIDHHHVGKNVPSCDVFINPQQKGCGFAEGIMCASGLAWYLLIALKNHIPAAAKIDLREYLDLACMGTICDMVPLTGANRVIAKRGLEALTTSNKVGLRALKNVIGIKRAVTCYDVSFGLGPRINAAGRMVHGEMVIDLLTTNDSEMAARLAARLNKLNSERQDTELLVKDRAIEFVHTQKSLPAGIVVWDKDFHTGVIGIVAQRLVERFYRPSAVLGVDTPGIYKGSVRGIKGFSVVEALADVGANLIKFGGHDGAGGFSVAENKLEDFKTAFEATCAERLKQIDTEPSVDADTEIELHEVSKGLVNELQRFAPFGIGNPGPTLLARNVHVIEVRDIKGAHLKVHLSDGTRHISGLMWRTTEHPALYPHAKVNIAFRPEISSFNGIEEVQATLQAVEHAG